MVKLCRVRVPKGTGLGKLSLKTHHFGIVFELQRVILVGDGQVELFKSVDHMLSYVEAWSIYQNPHRAFLEDGTEIELTSNLERSKKKLLLRFLDETGTVSAIKTEKMDEPYLKLAIIEFMIKSRVTTENIYLDELNLSALISEFERTLGYCH